MIRKIGKKWFICYDANGSPLDGPFASEAIANGAYESMRPFDKMIVSGRPPHSVTDREFLMGTENGRQFAKNEAYGNTVKKLCEAQGGSVKGKKYISQLCRAGRPGDPRAWVGSRAEVAKILEQDGSGSEGLVKAKARPLDEERKPIPIADRVVKQTVARELQGQVVSKKEYAKKCDEVRDRITPDWKK